MDVGVLHGGMDGIVHERVLGESDRAADLRAAVERAAFWMAVALPLAYVPVLGGTLGEQFGTWLLGVLLCVHLVVLGVGHTHRR